ncbi:hypothetical protein WA538_000881 [Blastocystis sp. DL]
MAEEKTDFDALKQRCFLDGYVTGRKETKKLGDSEYQVTFFQGDHSTEYMVAEMKDGEVDGTVQLFDKGVIQLSWTCEKGKRKGGVKVFQDGVVTQCVSWLSFSGDEVAVLENRSEKTLLVIRNPDNNVVIYRGEYGKDGVSREGYGFDYDEKTGVVLHYGVFKENKLYHVIQEFETATRMIEYEDGSEENVESLMNRRPVYVGGYSYDTQSGFYERHGVGRSIDPDTGIACEENEWCYGKEVEKREKTVQKGWYVSNNLDNNSLRVVVGVERANTAPSDTGAHYHPVVKIDVSNIPAVKYTVNNRNTFFSIPSNVTHLTVNSNCCNDYDITSFDMTKYRQLISIIIGEYSFQSVTTVNVSNLRLQTFQIGEHTFRTNAQSS